MFNLTVFISALAANATFKIGVKALKTATKFAMTKAPTSKKVAKKAPKTTPENK